MHDCTCQEKWTQCSHSLKSLYLQVVSGLAVPKGETKGRHDVKSFFCSPSFLHELRFFAQYALGEGIPLFQLTTVKALAVIIRRIVSNANHEHCLGFMQWDSLTQNFEYSNLGLIRSLSELSNQLAAEFDR